MTERIITQERLKELLHYNPDTGIFIWKVKKSRVSIGDTAGSRCHKYLTVKLDQVRYLSHRLAWLYVYGEWLNKDIDHINRVTTDNRICNLRPATRSENSQNRGIQSNNKFGLVGVSECKRTNKYRAYITINKKFIALGTYETPELAHEAYLMAKLKIHTFNPVVNYLHSTV
jgi:hypothetical protein